MSGKHSLSDSPFGVQPHWWNGHGYKTELLDKAVVPGALLVIGKPESDLAKFWVSYNPHGPGFNAYWWVDHGNGNVRGHMVMPYDVLRRAFGLAVTGLASEDHEDGMFTRRGDWLNIPCKGSGDFGDPNLSIMVNEGMRREVKKLLEEFQGVMLV